MAQKISFDFGNTAYKAGEADIDNDKTNKLKKAYQDYFNGNALYLNNLVICVVEVEKENIKKISPFYNNGYFKDRLTTLNLEDVVKELDNYGL